MRMDMLFSWDVLIEALKEQGVEETYENLYPLFENFTITVISWERGVIGEFSNPSDFYEFLEEVYNKIQEEA